MKNVKIFITLGCFCVLAVTSLSVYQEHKKKRRAEYQRIALEAHQHIKSLHTWDNTDNSSPDLARDNESAFSR